MSIPPLPRKPQCLLWSSQQPWAQPREAHGWGKWRDGGGGVCGGGGINERSGQWSVYRAKIMRWDSEELRSGGHQKHSVDDMETKIIYFTVNGRPEQAEFPVDCPAQSLKGRRSRLSWFSSLHHYIDAAHNFLSALSPCVASSKVSAYCLEQTLANYSAGPVCGPLGFLTCPFNWH